MRVNAIKCLKCKDTVFSRARHDWRSCSCGNCFIDGGFEYMRCGATDVSKIKNVKVLVNATERELFLDWSYRKDKYGLIRRKK